MVTTGRPSPDARLGRARYLSIGLTKNVNEDAPHEPVRNAAVTGATYKALAFDKRISHGAFRLWHVLRDFAGNKLKCWPGQRRLMRSLGSNFETIGRWRDELIHTGWLKVSNLGKKGVVHIYELIPLPSATGSGSAVLPEAAAPAATESGSETNEIKLTKGSKENAPPIFESVKRGLYRKEYQGMIQDAETEIKTTKANPALHERVLKKDVGLLCKFLQDEARAKPEKAAANLKRAGGYENDSANYCAGKLTPQGKAIVSAWENRIAEIRRVMNGVITLPAPGSGKT